MKSRHCCDEILSLWLGFTWFTLGLGRFHKTKLSEMPKLRWDGKNSEAGGKNFKDEKPDQRIAGHESRITS